MLKGKIIIKDSNEKIEKNFLSASEKELKTIFQSAKPKIESGIKNLVLSALLNCPEIKSLQSGQLRLDFGLPIDPTNEIITAVVNSTYVYFKNFRFTKYTVKNVFSIYIQPSDFRNLIDNAYANVITEQGEVLPWLEWLLTAGDAVVISGYSVEYGPNKNSRTGAAVMVPVGFFKVDSQYSGTVENNFITRALQGKENEISEIIRKNL